MSVETNKKVNIKNSKIIQNHSHIRLDFCLKWQEFEKCKNENGYMYYDVD